MRFRAPITALAALAVATTLAAGGAAAATDGPAVTRLAGNNRYETAAAVSRQFPTGPEYAFIASGENFPDALPGAALAGSKDSPLLLVEKGEMSSHTIEELTRLQPQEIVVLGGEGVVSERVETQLAQYATTGTVTRLSGTNRYETASAVSETYAPGPDYAFVATGENFPDALSGTALAARRDAPLLLVPDTGLTPATATELTRLKPKKIIILGGTNAVSSDIEGQLRQYATSGASDEVTRISGKDRYATSAAIAEQFTSSTTAYVATGEHFPDALAGGARAGSVEAPLLLTEKATLPWIVDQQLVRLGPSNAYILGGEGAISDRVRTAAAGGTPAPIIKPKPIVSWNGEGAWVEDSRTLSTRMHDNGSEFELVKMLAIGSAKARFPVVARGVGMPNADGSTPYSMKASIIGQSGYARSEIINTYDADMYSQQAFGYNMLVPRNQKAPVGKQWWIFSQIKQTNCGVPPLGFYWTEDSGPSDSTMHFEMRLHNDQTGWRPTDPYRVVFRGTMPKGEWNRLAMTWTASPNNPRNAYFNLWINGKKVEVELPEGEAIGYTSACTEYAVPMSMNLRIGVYRGGDVWANEGVAYFDNMKFGTTYADVDN